jgi:hypothetical protein
MGPHDFLPGAGKLLGGNQIVGQKLGQFSQLPFTNALRVFQLRYRSADFVFQRRQIIGITHFERHQPAKKTDFKRTTLQCGHIEVFDEVMSAGSEATVDNIGQYKDEDASDEQNPQKIPSQSTDKHHRHPYDGDNKDLQQYDKVSQKEALHRLALFYFVYKIHIFISFSIVWAKAACTAPLADFYRAVDKIQP